MSEQAMNQSLHELQDRIENVLSRRTNQVIKSIGSVRLTISDLLAENEEGGKIPQSNVSSVMSGLNGIEEQLYRDMRTELHSVVKGVTETSVSSITGALVTAIGIPALTTFIGIEAINTITSEALFGLLVGTGVLDFITSVVSSVFSRKGTDGKDLNDRIRSLAKLLAGEIRDTLRKNIITGEDNAVIIRDLVKEINDNDWRLSTIVETESMFAMRQSVAKFAEESGIVKAIRIIDIPHGKPSEHRRHMCYKYANKDEHGLGVGVYPVGTRKIRNPHPRCRSMLEYVMTDDFS